MTCHTCGGIVSDPDGIHRAAECIAYLKAKLLERESNPAESVKEAVKAERRRMRQAVESLPNRDEVLKLLYPPGESPPKQKSRWVPVSELPLGYS